jgi:hypothetical protein
MIIKKASKSCPEFKTAIIFATLLTVSICYSGNGSIYPDFGIRYVSPGHLTINYSPDFSDDLLSFRGADLIRLNGKDVWGRVFLVAVPPDGDLDFSVNFRRHGTAEAPPDGRFITGGNSLIIRGSTIEARRHRIVRMYIFPQRLEEGRLAAYTDIEIDIYFAVGNKAEIPGRLCRLDSVLATAVVNPDQFFGFGASPRPRAAYKRLTGMFDNSAQWLKITVNENGVTRIGGSNLQQSGISLTDLSSDSIRIFYAGGKNPPEDPSDADPELYQVAISVEDGGDGKIDAGDNILFYAEAPSRFEYESGKPEYLKNPYNDRNYYWLAVGGYAGVTPLRWEHNDGSPAVTPDHLVAATRQMVRVEQDNILDSDGGYIWNYYDWYWSDQEAMSVSVNLPGLSAGDSIDVAIKAIGGFAGTDIALNGTLMNRYYEHGNRYWDKSGAAVPGLNTMQIAIKPHGSGTYLDYLDISYLMRLHYDNDQLDFNSSDYSGLLRYLVTGFNSSLSALDITDPDRPALVDGIEISGDTARFQFLAGETAASRFIVCATGDVKYPTAVEKIGIAGLRTDLSQYDCLVVSPRGFQEALQEYVTCRQATDGYRIKLAGLEDVYNSFGFGLESPMAIRSYLEYAYENYDAPAPCAVVLVGDGHYDYLDNMNRHAPSYIPPYIWSRVTSVGDDNYVYFGKLDWLDSDSSYIIVPDRGWDMMIARWPVRSSAEVSDYVAKLKNYESDETKGSWRSRITYVADDEFKGESSSEIIHTAMAETLAVFHTPAEFVKQKIYLTEYPFAASGEKPAVNDAIIRAVNEGTLILNYIGHGSPEVWADEHVLKKSADLNRMNNSDKLTVVIAASCSIGFFDSPDRESMAEIMFRQQGGAITTVSAMRMVYAGDNSIFNYDLYDVVFAGRYNISEAVFTTKMLHQYDNDFSLIQNDRSYVVFGDPMGRLGLPERRLEIVPEDGDELIPLERFGFTGRVTDTAGNTASVDGTVEITVYDSPIIRHHQLGLDYSLTGPVIFRGPVEVENGLFGGQFMVPLDVDYGGSAARISGYGSLGVASALGGLDSLKISENISATTDNSGPSIVYSIEEAPGFISGGRIPANATLVLEISDNSGINLTGGLGHRVELIFDNDNNTTINLTDLFSYYSGSYQTGEIRFTLPDLTPEMHVFKVKAWDNVNNPAMVEFEAIPSQEGRIAIHNLMNYPNPMEEATEFFFELSESAESVELRIFTLSGKMIKSFREENPAVGRNRLFYWNGCDADGDRIAEGVYIYKLTARGRVVSKGPSADNIAEVFSKLVLLN